MKLLLVVLGLLTALLVSLTRRVRRLYADSHFREILVSAGRLKADALASIQSGKSAYAAQLLTSAPLIIAYSVTHDAEPGLLHHISLSTPLTHAAAAGTYFLALVEWAVGLKEATRVSTFVSENRVFHLVHRLDQGMHEHYAEVPVQQGLDVAAARKAALSRQSSLRSRLVREAADRADPASPA